MKTNLRGDMLRGYRGKCEKCGSEKRVYFANCDDRMRDLMLNYDKMMKSRGTCEVCYVGCSLKHSVWWISDMSMEQVDKDLAILGNGINITQQDYENSVNEIKEGDQWWENQEGRVAEYKQHLKKKGFT